MEKIQAMLPGLVAQNQVLDLFKEIAGILAENGQQVPDELLGVVRIRHGDDERAATASQRVIMLDRKLMGLRRSGDRRVPSFRVRLERDVLSQAEQPCFPGKVWGCRALCREIKRRRLWR